MKSKNKQLWTVLCNDLQCGSYRDLTCDYFLHPNLCISPHCYKLQRQLKSLLLMGTFLFSVAALLHLSIFLVSKFTTVQDSSQVLGKVHKTCFRSYWMLPLNQFSSLAMALLHLLNRDCRPQPFSKPFSSRWSMVMSQAVHLKTLLQPPQHSRFFCNLAYNLNNRSQPHLSQHPGSLTYHNIQAGSPITTSRQAHLSQHPGRLTYHNIQAGSPITTSRQAHLSQHPGRLTYHNIQAASPITTSRQAHLSQHPGRLTYHNIQAGSPFTTSRYNHLSMWLQKHTFQKCSFCARPKNK